VADLRTESSHPSDGADDAPVTASTGHEGESVDRGRSSRAFWTELPFLVVIALVLAILLKTFVVQAFYIPSSSMEPTLLIGDRVLVTKTAYLYREPRRGEVVVFSEDLDVEDEDGNLLMGTLQSLASGLGVTEPSERDFIKRIIGLPGETIEMRGGVVLIDGEPIPEATSTDGGYLSRPDLTDFGPVTVEEGHYFMMGDNRPNSADSRYGLGQIPRDQILGRAFVIIWPLGSAGSLPIADYAG
jgi:signal peptidase I